MSSHTTLVLLITLLIVTMGGVLVFYEVTQNSQQSATGQVTQQIAEATHDLELVNVIGYNISSDSFRYVKMQVRYDGDGRLNLNDTHIQLRTEQSEVDLTYRNGSTARSTASGFYTS